MLRCRESVLCSVSSVMTLLECPVIGVVAATKPPSECLCRAGKQAPRRQQGRGTSCAVVLGPALCTALSKGCEVLCPPVLLICPLASMGMGDGRGQEQKGH